MPLVTFVALIQLMDNFRVFEPIVGFNAEAHATSLSWIIFNDLGGETRQFSAAGPEFSADYCRGRYPSVPVLARTGVISRTRNNGFWRQPKTSRI
ncbi:MAG: hypothetical protein CM1200mP18_11880 [Gammaproteobacteria bacterium]|nr:MAG: hypothetical protein CM1200mP18_11880 [Gammaproteobacteria bacterium]